MKKSLFILLGMYMMVSIVEASNGKKSPNNFQFRCLSENAVNFEERGIEFFIFTNGEFDFNTHYNDTYYDYNGNRTRKQRAINIDRDYRGRIQRIGNSFITYDRFGNVTRIGNVFMKYYRGKLTNVGNLKVVYNFFGNPSFYGNVKDNYNGFRIDLNIGDIYNYNNAYFFRHDFRANYSKIREDKNYYYYRANPNATIGNRSKTLRRRKVASTILKKKSKIKKRKSNTTLNSKRKVVLENRNNYRKSNVAKRNIKRATNKKIKRKNKKNSRR